MCVVVFFFLVSSLFFLRYPLFPLSSHTTTKHTPKSPPQRQGGDGAHPADDEPAGAAAAAARRAARHHHHLPRDHDVGAARVGVGGRRRRAQGVRLCWDVCGGVSRAEPAKGLAAVFFILRVRQPEVRLCTLLSHSRPLLRNTLQTQQAVKVNALGKWKTALQMTSMSMLLFFRDETHTMPAVFGAFLFCLAAIFFRAHLCGTAECMQTQHTTRQHTDARTYMLMHQHALPTHTHAGHISNGADAVNFAWLLLWGSAGLAIWSLSTYFANVWTHFVYPVAKTA